MYLSPINRQTAIPVQHCLLKFLPVSEQPFLVPRNLVHCASADPVPFVLDDYRCPLVIDGERVSTPEPPASDTRTGHDAEPTGGGDKVVLDESLQSTFTGERLWATFHEILFARYSHQRFCNVSE